MRKIKYRLQMESYTCERLLARYKIFTYTRKKNMAGKGLVMRTKRFYGKPINYLSKLSHTWKLKVHF